MLGVPNNPLCGIDWVRDHLHDLDGWHPTIEIIRPGSKQTFTIKSEEAMDAVVKVMHQNTKKGK